MVILGVDPGSRVTGWGLVSITGNRLQCLDYGALRLSRGGKLPAIPDRLKTIHAEIQRLLQAYSPDCMAVEGVFYAANVKSALTLGHVRGAILLASAQAGVPVVEFSPLEVKKAVVGYGRAEKGQIQMMVRTLLPGCDPENADSADALAVAICHAHLRLTAARVAALEAAS